MRAVAVVTCVVVLAGFVLWFFGPKSAGTFGLAYGGGVRATISAVDDASPFKREDVRPGDVIRFDRMPLAQRLALTNPIVGTPATIALERGAALRTLSAVADAAPPPLFARWMAIWLLTFLYAAMALLIAWRAPTGLLRTVIMSIVAPIAIAYNLATIAGSIPSPVAGAVDELIGRLCISTFLIGAFFFILAFPPRSTRLTRWLKSVGFPVAIVASTLFFLGADDSFRVLPFDAETVGSYFEIASSFVWIVGIVDAATAAGTQYRAQVLVAGSTLLLLSLVDILEAVTSINGFRAEWIPYVLWLQWACGFGVSFAVLRHRLLDLNVVVSRAAIFSVVSLSLIAIFILAEWVLATVLERTIGPDFGENGKTTLTAIVALCVGLSARGVHYVVEHRLNRVFFAKRYRALADLHRFALETDVATDSTALLALTIETLRRDLAAEYVVVFTGTPESGYIAAGTSVDPRCPLRIDQNEEIVLRLRRFGEPFVIENESHPLAAAYVSPMMLRGTLYGFAICGPKLDRSSYLSDERAAVADLAHRVGIAYEWLTRATAPNFAGT